MIRTGPVLVFVLPLVLSWLLTALLIRLAPRLRLLDHPGERKHHGRSVPKGGGLAFTAAVLVTVLLVDCGSPRRLLVLLGAGLVIVLLGLADDVRPLSWQLRLAVQFAVTLAAVSLWPAPAGWPLRLLGVVWVVALLNALNMLDNMDALAASVAWVAAGALAVLALLRQPGLAPGHPALLFLALMGALAGYLWFNRPPARIFMGDAGSTFLGFLLGLSTLDLSLDETATPWARAVPLCLLAVPCYDLVSVVLLRLSQGRSPFHADRQHLSHRLVAAGLRPPLAVAVIDLLALASGALGLLLYESPSWPGAVLIGAVFVGGWATLAAFEFLVLRRR